MPPRPFPPSIQVTGMSTMQKSSMILLALAAVLATQSGVVGQRAPAVQSPPSPGRDWMYHGGEPGGTRFSTLTQVNAGNVKNLTRAWTFHTGHTAGTFESTPLVIDSVLYFNASNGVFALDAVTGQQIWKYRTEGPSTRGPEYWPGGGGYTPQALHDNQRGTGGPRSEDRQARYGIRHQRSRRERRTIELAAISLQKPGDHPRQRSQRSSVGHHHR